MIVAVGEGALAFAMERGSTPWPDVPIVFAAFDDRSPVLQRLPPTVTGEPVREVSAASA